MPVFHFVPSSSSNNSSDEDFLDEGDNEGRCYSWINEAKQDEFHRFWVDNITLDTFPYDDTETNPNSEELHRISVCLTFGRLTLNCIEAFSFVGEF